MTLLLLGPGAGGGGGASNPFALVQSKTSTQIADSTPTIAWDTPPVSGHLLICIVVSGGGISNSLTGWTFVDEELNVNDTNLWYRVADGGANDTPNLGTIGGAWNTLIAVAEFSGTDAAPFDLNGTSANVNTTPYAFLQETPSAGDRLVIQIIGGTASSTTNNLNNTASGYTNTTELFDFGTNSRSNDGVGTSLGAGCDNIAIVAGYLRVTADGSTAYGDTTITGSLFNFQHKLRAAFKVNETVGGTTYTEPALTAGTLPIAGSSITPVYNISASLTPGTLPIAAGTTAPVYNITEAIVTGSLPITGGTVVPKYTWQEAAFTPGTLPIVGGSPAVTYGINEGAFTPGTLPISIGTTNPIFAIIEATFTAGTLPIAAGSTSPVYNIQEATLTAGLLPITGGTVTPKQTWTEAALTPGLVPIAAGSTSPVYNITEPALTPGLIPITEQNITPIWSGGGINYSSTLTAGSLPIVGATVTAKYGWTEAAFTPGTVPIVGSAITPRYGLYASLTPATLPIAGATVTPIVVLAAPVVADPGGSSFGSANQRKKLKKRKKRIVLWENGKAVVQEAVEAAPAPPSPEAIAHAKEALSDVLSQPDEAFTQDVPLSAKAIEGKQRRDRQRRDEDDIAAILMAIW